MSSRYMLVALNKKHVRTGRTEHIGRHWLVGPDQGDWLVEGIGI